ncbi:MAG: hypothetical protein BGN88_14725 [Clostridiales bacterium 43-6]|nr:MAG: hypothetical protein BGN88_14725 [Clostridiales bacterium 43-6]
MDRSILKKRRKQLGLTQQHIADIIGVQKPTYQRYESGVIKRIDINMIEKLSNALKTTPEYLMGWERNETEPSAALPVETEMINVPILGNVAAGQNILADSNVSGYEPVPKSELKKDAEYFYLTVKGDSMYPIIMENDMVLVRKQSELDSGSYAVVTVDGEEGLVKKIIYGKNFIELHSENHYYPVRKYTGNSVKSVCIIGKVVEVKRKF